MIRIASPRDLQAELRRLIEACDTTRPSRGVLAYELRRLASKVSGEEEAEDSSPVEKAKKKGEWNLVVSKSRSRWSYFMENPQGGGGGSGSYPSMKAAINAGMRTAWWQYPDKSKVHVIVAEWSPDDENYVVKKTYSVDIPEEARQKPTKEHSKEEIWDMMTR